MAIRNKNGEDLGKKIAIVVLALGFGGMFVAGVVTNDGGSSASASSKPKIQQAYDGCAVSSPVISTGDGGDTLLVAGAKSEDMGDLACVMIRLDASQALVQQIDSTTALMGRQTASEHGLDYAWSYYPDSGLQMTVTD